MPAPHVPAAFINAIAEEGTKEEAVAFLQEQWNENCELRRQLAAVSKSPVVNDAPCPNCGFKPVKKKFRCCHCGEESDKPHDGYCGVC